MKTENKSKTNDEKLFREAALSFLQWQINRNQQEIEELAEQKAILYMEANGSPDGLFNPIQLIELSEISKNEAVALMKREDLYAQEAEILSEELEPDIEEQIEERENQVPTESVDQSMSNEIDPSLSDNEIQADEPLTETLEELQDLRDESEDLDKSDDLEDDLER